MITRDIRGDPSSLTRHLGKIYIQKADVNVFALVISLGILFTTTGVPGMLPKVVTHFLHTTSRAAAQAVQAPLRNVFQTGSSSGPNLGNWNGNSNWGGHGPGAGSAKQNSGSRYYSSFNVSSPILMRHLGTWPQSFISTDVWESCFAGECCLS